MVAQMRQSPMWPGLEAIAHTLAYDVTIIGDTQRGDPLPLRKWATITVPTLVMGGEKSPVELRGAVDAVAQTIPGARLQMLKGQTHNVSVKVLAPVLVDFFAASEG